MGLTGGRDVLGLNGEDDSCPLVSGSSTPTSPSNRPHSGGYINEAIIDSEGTRPSYNKIQPSETIDNTINASITAKNFNIENNRSAVSTICTFKSLPYFYHLSSYFILLLYIHIYV